MIQHRADICRDEPRRPVFSRSPDSFPLEVERDNDDRLSGGVRSLIFGKGLTLQGTSEVWVRPDVDLRASRPPLFRPGLVLSADWFSSDMPISII